MTLFAEGLNIPIGLYPFCTPNADGKLTWKCIAWSIPNLWLFEDTDGDGKADKREPLYGPFDHTRDTHGNQASLHGFDGWLYATPGSTTIRMSRAAMAISGLEPATPIACVSTARGSNHTWGQVNPFGLAWDAFGNLYSSDCHSAPTYQLLAGGYYPASASRTTVSALRAHGAQPAPPPSTASLLHRQPLARRVPRTISSSATS